jgi:hypothetical protein
MASQNLRFQVQLVPLHQGIEFRFKEEEGAADYTETMAMTMRRHSHEDCLRGGAVQVEFSLPIA